MNAVWIEAPSASPIHGWLADFERAAAITQARLVVCDASSVVETRRTLESGIPLVACCPLAPGEDLVAAGAFEHVAMRADAYATLERDLAEAVAFARSEDRSARGRGPLRLTWLGALGQLPPIRMGPVGRAHELGESTFVGRDAACDIVLRTGAHSDQNTVARQHAVIVRDGSRVRVRDLSSTNGTWVDGRSIRDEALAPGCELAFAATLRFRLDGTAD